LSLQANKLTSVGNNLVNLENLKELYLGENFLTKIEGLEHVPNLTILDISYNKIEKLEGIDQLKQLEELWLNTNKIENFADLDILKHNSTLKTVYLASNPVALFPSYRQKIMELIPELEQIDAVPIKVTYNFIIKKD